MIVKYLQSFFLTIRTTFYILLLITITGVLLHKMADDRVRSTVKLEQELFKTQIGGLVQAKIREAYEEGFKAGYRKREEIEERKKKSI